MILGTLATVGVFALGVLFVLAVRIRTECNLHDLHTTARRKRRERARRLAMLGHGGDLGDVGDVADAGSDDGWDVEMVEEAA